MLLRKIWGTDFPKSEEKEVVTQTKHLHIYGRNVDSFWTECQRHMRM